MYGSNPNWSDEPALNRCTYYVVIDKLQRAKEMCIRDRYKGTVSGFFPENAVVSVDCSHRGTAVGQVNPDSRIYPVSYTHLDVYKRQEDKLLT